VLAILGALAAEYDKSTLVAVLQGLSPQVLADCVIANMAHLPAGDTIAGTGSSSGLVGLMQVGCIPSFFHLRNQIGCIPALIPAASLTCLLALSFIQSFVHQASHISIHPCR